LKIIFKIFYTVIMICSLLLGIIKLIASTQREGQLTGAIFMFIMFMLMLIFYFVGNGNNKF